jgi:hypothetical protein
MVTDAGYGAPNRGFSKTFDNRVLLQLDLESGHSADAIVAGEALIAWVEAMREANRILDPLSEIKVDLVSAEAACLRLWAAVEFIEAKLLGNASRALDSVPRIKKFVVAGVLGATGGIAATGGAMLILPDQTVHIAPEEKPAYEGAKREIEESPAVQSKVRRFYGAVQRDRRITGVMVAEDVAQPPIVRVPREEFAVRSGLFVPGVDTPERDQHAVWEAVITHPALFSEPRVWGFIRDGLPFTARVEDDSFLRAIHDGTLPIRIQEGVILQVEIVWRERLEGQAWVPVPRSRRIIRVISPKPRED